MKSLFSIVILVILTVVFAGCPYINKPEYKQGVFPRYPVNFSEVNSEYDDYNSALPVIQDNQYLYFSSNRNSSGQNFDIVGDNLNIWWDQESGLLSINNNNTYYDLGFTDTLFSIINTSANEFGPFALNYWSENDQNQYLRYDLVVYSSNYESDKYISKFVYYKSNDNISGTYYGPFDIKLTDTLSGVQYISFMSEEDYDVTVWDENPQDFEKMIFNADIDGNTGIFSIELPVNDNFIEMLKSDTTILPTLIPTINSNSQDKCPFVNAHLMVFTSNRSGGYGGYDLYYSWYENGIWSSPVNFGEDINTEYDEFRPVTISVEGFINDLMIFSSNRPGGKGGFDLYYVGLPFKVQELLYIKSS